MKNVVLINYTCTHEHICTLTRIHKSYRKIAGPINLIGSFLLLDLLLFFACARRFDHFRHTRDSIVSRISAQNRGTAKHNLDGENTLQFLPRHRP